MNSGTIWGRFVEKTRGQKSRATVPLKRKKISLPFCFEEKMMAVFCFRFAHLLRSDKDGSFSLPFCFISLRSKNYGSFSLLFRFVFVSFHFCFASDFYVSHRCETSEKSPFFRIEAKKISLPFRFISLRSENDGAPYPGVFTTQIGFQKKFWYKIHQGVATPM